MNSTVLFRSAVIVLCLWVVAVKVDLNPSGPAMAQDDDGGNDDGADDDGGGNGDGDGGAGAGGGDDDDDDADGIGASDGRRPGNAPLPRRAAPATAPAVLPVDLPDFVPGELVALSLDEADLGLLLARGYTVLEERAVPEFGGISRRLSVPAGTTLDAARTEVRALASGADADFNHYYLSEQDDDPAICEGQHCASFELIGWQTSATANCNADIVVGVIDTGINPDHPTFAQSRLEVHKLAPSALDPSRAIHGTAVTALLVGDPGGRSPGLLPGARVVAVDAFHSDGGDERADVYTLVAALDFLAAKGIRVLNLSLAGPPNTVLERTVKTLVASDVVLVAATGNGGPEADPVYPAAYPDVVAVTAVDKTGTVYRRAGRGGHVDLAAPGVEVWTAASINGARPKTGTSFAVPFVTAAAATYLAADPTLPAKVLIARLTATARDLGTPGYDETYGHGLVQAAPACVARTSADQP